VFGIARRLGGDETRDLRRGQRGRWVSLVLNPSDALFPELPIGRHRAVSTLPEIASYRETATLKQRLE
jgi:hypothetical protein